MQEVTVVASAQVGKTLMQKAVIGYYSEIEPSPMLMVQPTLEMAEAFSKDRYAPMVRDCPSLKRLYPDPKSRDSGNTLLHKSFPGGHCTLAGANSPASLASRPIRVVLLDEPDRYPKSAGTEGNPSKLAIARTKAFPNRKIFRTSTPTVEGSSEIWANWLKSDQRRFTVACPHCDARWWFDFRHFRWPEGKPSEARYVCPECGSEITDIDKPRMLAAGEWVPQNPQGTHPGFHIWEAYAPWRRFGEIACDFIDAKESPETLQVFRNTSQGEVWKDAANAYDAKQLAERATQIEKGVAPSWAAVLVVGVDTQGDRLSIQPAVFGWDGGLVFQPVDWYETPGDPTDPATFEAMLGRCQLGVAREDGVLLRPRLLAIDSGYKTQEVYNFARSNRNVGVIATKGMRDSAGGSIMKQRPSRVDFKLNGKAIKRGAEVWPVNVNEAKNWIQRRINSGAMRFPSGLDPRYYEQLTAEVYDAKQKRWLNTKGKRNEAFDTLVLCVAAAFHPAIRIDQLRAQQFDEIQARYRRLQGEKRPVSAPVAAPSAPAVAAQPKKPFVKAPAVRKVGGFVRNW